MSVGSYIAALLASEKLGGQVTCHRLLPAADPQYAQTRLPWPTAISRILEQRGIAGLYSHQALATDGDHIGVAAQCPLQAVEQARTEQGGPLGQVLAGHDVEHRARDPASERVAAKGRAVLPG